MGITDSQIDKDLAALDADETHQEACHAAASQRMAAMLESGDTMLMDYLVDAVKTQAGIQRQLYAAIMSDPAFAFLHDAIYQGIYEDTDI